MSLRSEQVDLFHNQGYTVAEGFFNRREVAALQAEVERFKAAGLLRNVATDGDGETPSSSKENLQLLPLFDKSDLIRALPFEPKVVEAGRQLIGTPFILHLDQMFLKPAHHGIGTAWHQDNAYFKIADPLRGTAMWIAIHDATVANGTLNIIPGSYQEEYEHYRDPNSNHHIRCAPPEERAVSLELKAGSIAFFCYGTAHCTRANTTDRERAGMAFHFLHTDYVDKKRDRPLLCGPDATGGTAEYGVQVANTWTREVDRILNTA